MTSFNSQDPIAIALFILTAFILSGTVHVLWLKNTISIPLKIPIDGGYSFRGVRIFGDNKTIRGLVIIIPATGVSFYLIAVLRPYLPMWLAEGIWAIDTLIYMQAGLIAATGFMLAELPNSFIKRQFGVAPGEQPNNKFWRIVTTIVDRIDSLIGMMFFLSLLLPIPWLTWVYLLVIGPGIHSLFSYWLFKLKVKDRPG